MIKWFAYIVLLLIMAPGLSSAKERAIPNAFFYHNTTRVANSMLIDTTSSKSAKRQQDAEDRKKIKEIAKARRQPKPEKIGPADATPAITKKTKRQRRPEGLEQPPEIPRRNDN